MATKNLIVRIGADLSDLAKATDAARGHFAKLEQVRKSAAANQQDSLTKELEAANQKVQQLKNEYRQLTGTMGQTSTENGLLKQLRDVQKARADLDKQYANKDGSIKDTTPEAILQQYEVLEKRADELYDKIRQIRLDPASTPEAKALGDKLKEAAQHASDLQKELNKSKAENPDTGKGTSMKAKVLDGLTGAGNVAMKGFAGLATGAGKALQLIQTGAGKAARFMGSIRSAAGNALGGITSMGTGIGRVAGRIGSLAASALVFNVLSKGFQAVQQGITGMIEGDSQLKASLASLQGNLLTAFAPLWQTILPIVRAVTAALASLAGMVAQVMASLFGTTTSAAQKSAQAYYKQAGAATGSANASKKAAEEAKREAADFDILHKVGNDSSTDSSGSGGGGSVTPDLTTDISQTGSFVDKLTNAIKDDDWYKVGEIFAEKLNEAMEAIPWEGIQSTAKRWAENIATTLNGFVETLDWGLVGSTLGNGLNTALGFMDTFVQTFHWESLGTGIGNGLEGMRQVVDWSLVGRWLTNGLKAAFETLHGFVTSGFNWGGLGDDLATAINSAWGNIDWVQAAVDLGELAKDVLESLTAMVQGIDFFQIGRDVGKALASIDWFGILGEVVALGIGALGAILGTGFGLIVGVFEGLGATLGKYFGGIGEEGAQGFFDGLWELFSDIGGWVMQHIVDPFVKAVKTALGIHSPSTVMKEIGDNTAQGFFDGITELWDSITGWLGEHLGGIVGQFNDWKDQTGQKISQWASSTGETVRGWISDTAQNVGGWVSDRKQDFTNWASSVGQTVGSWASDAKQKIADWAGSSKNSVGDFSTDSKGKLGSYSTETQGTLGRWKDTAVGIFKTFGDLGKSTMQTAINGISGTLLPLVSNALNWGSDFVQNFTNGIKNKMTGLLDSVKNMANQVRGYLHFSVPDTGPLADADTWMPDFMDLLAEGVDDNSPTLLAKIQNVARQVNRAYNGTATPALATAGGMSLPGDPMRRMDSSSDDIIATLRSGFNALQKAVEDKDNSVYLDGDKVENRTAKSRRKKARLYGRDE